jgi:hypothetical protein
VAYIRPLSLAPIFLLTLVIVVFAQIPNVYAGSPLSFVFQYNDDFCTGTCHITGASVKTGDLLIVQDNLDNCGVGAFSSNPTETWVGTQTFGDYQIMTAIAHSTASYSFTCTNAAPGSFGPFYVSVFRGTFNGFGSAVMDTPGASQSGSDTINLNVQAGSIIYEGFLAYNNNQGPSNCPTVVALNGQVQRGNDCIQAGPSSVLGASYNVGPTAGVGTLSAGVSWAGCTGGSSTTCQTIRHSALELTSIPPSPNVGVTTPCYGVCGNPAVTLINANATHTLNFNISSTLFYIMQSQLNGFVDNVTVNVAKSYTNGVVAYLGIYTTTCPIQTQPFSASCPGVLQTSKGFTNPAKGFLNLPLQTPMAIGQWMGIAVSSSIGPLDLNETNGSCGGTGAVNCAFPPGGVVASGIMPSQISSYIPTTILHMNNTGIWAFVTGSITSGVQPPPIGSICNQNVDLVCFEYNSICALSPSNCMVGGLVYMFGYFLIISFSVNLGLWWLKRETEIEGSIHPVFYPMLLLFLSYFMWGVGVFPLSVIILETALIILGIVGVVRATSGIGQE